MEETRRLSLACLAVQLVELWKQLYVARRQSHYLMLFIPETMTLC